MKNFNKEYMDINFLKKQLKNEIKYIKDNNLKNDYKKSKEYFSIMKDIKKLRDLIRVENGYLFKRNNY